MSPPEESGREEFLDALGRLGPALLGTMEAFEFVSRRLDPAATQDLRAATVSLRKRLEVALGDFQAAAVPEPAAALAERLEEASGHAVEALRLFTESGDPQHAVARILGSMSLQCRVQECLYPLRKALLPVSRHFLETPLRDREPDPAASLDPDPPAQERTGVMHAHNEIDARGGFSLYVPESVARDEPRPLIVALHGGSGHGRDYVWTWLREARSRRCLLLAPTSRGSTWSFNGPDVDAASIHSMLQFVNEGWSVDPERVLLTGLSDGATYTLVSGLQEESPFTALAPLSGVLHPVNHANGNLARAKGKRIYLVHGALDWMFPVTLARLARQELEQAGADLVYREIEDLSHAYAREENAKILEWLDPSLALPDG